MSPSRLFAFVATLALLPAIHLQAQETLKMRPLTSSYTIGPSIQPMIIIGEGWQQKIVIVNVSYYSPEPTVGMVHFYNKDGKAWKVPLQGYGLTDHVEVNLNPGQMIVLETEVSWNPQSLGWASFDLVSNTDQWGIYHAYTVFRKQTAGQPDLMTSVPLVDALEDNWIIPFDNTGGKFPGIALVNTSSYSTTDFLLSVYDTQGNLIKTISKTVKPLCLEWFSLLAGNPDLADKQGQIKVTGGLFKSAMFTLQFAPSGAFTALPVVHSYGMK
jgi:hypothetical protein